MPDAENGLLRAKVARFNREQVIEFTSTEGTFSIRPVPVTELTRDLPPASDRGASDA